MKENTKIDEATRLLLLASESDDMNVAAHNLQRAANLVTNLIVKAITPYRAASAALIVFCLGSVAKTICERHHCENEVKALQDIFKTGAVATGDKKNGKS